MELAPAKNTRRANPATIRHTHGASVTATGVSQIVDAKPFKPYVWGGTAQHGVSQRPEGLTSGRVGTSGQIGPIG